MNNKFELFIFVSFDYKLLCKHNDSMNFLLHLLVIH